MNKRAFTVGLFYCAVAIAFKLFILLGGYTLTKFGFYYSNIVAVFLIIPFYWLAIKQVRDKDMGGVIAGKEAVRISLTVLAVAVVILSLYNYIEFNWRYKDIAIQYYNSSEYLDILKGMQAKYPDKIKTENFPKIIDEQIGALSAFKASTGKIFPLLLIGLSGSFIMSALMKRKQAN